MFSSYAAGFSANVSVNRLDDISKLTKMRNSAQLVRCCTVWLIFSMWSDCFRTILKIHWLIPGWIAPLLSTQQGFLSFFNEYWTKKKHNMNFLCVSVRCGHTFLKHVHFFPLLVTLLSCRVQFRELIKRFQMNGFKMRWTAKRCLLPGAVDCRILR